MHIKLHPSVTLDKLRRGENVFCFKSNLSCPRVIEIASLAGFNCLWTCSEHVSNNQSVLESQILATRSMGTDILVRVPRGSYSDLIHPLEMDASGIMVPHTMSADDARKIVYYTKFHPVGRRPVDGGNRDGLYCNIDFSEYIDFVNRNRFVMIQIEDIEAMDELDQICSVPGIDIIFFGPGDFSQSIGKPGECNAPEVIAARKNIAAAAKKHGKFCGTCVTAENCAEIASEGFQFLAMGADVIGLSQYCRNLIEQASETMKSQFSELK